jgi:hypothetical protein
MPTAKKKPAKKLDAKKLFVIMTVSRESIAEMLNCALEDTDGSMDHVNHFSEDDPRLTDEVCQDIANTLYDAMCNVDENDRAEHEVYSSALEQFA